MAKVTASVAAAKRWFPELWKLSLGIRKRVVKKNLLLIENKMDDFLICIVNLVVIGSNIYLCNVCS